MDQSQQLESEMVQMELNSQSPSASTLHEDLREASALGDADRAAALLAAGADPRSANRVNGWTALHWAAKRGHASVAKLLLRRGADPAAKTLAGQIPGDLVPAGNAALANVLADVVVDADADRSTAAAAKSAAVESAGTSGAAGGAGEFVPNYLRNPEFPYSSRVTGGPPQQRQQRLSSDPASMPLLLLVRVAKSSDPDFIEIELRNPVYADLLSLVCKELNVDPASVERIRKLPNVRLRNDSDISRLQSGQQLELVLRSF